MTLEQQARNAKWLALIQEQINERNEKMIVVQRVDKIEVYRNEDGDVVISQYDPTVGEDAVIWFPAQYASAVIEGIEAAAEPMEEVSFYESSK